ncbi:hypothetical protein CCACVL1_13347 [Corchorus capsularis]|uniref:Uncharacterized protein n=1 Tax=Corchorus capsularis TaxID=210143 RepID=A0A1R3IBD4_COCAP|nr:hypothetical protein CCACVL1_13347 [Corchorus capsularis]
MATLDHSVRTKPGVKQALTKQPIN